MSETTSIRCNKYEKSVTDCNIRLKIDPYSIDALIGKGYRASKAGVYDDALECFDRVLDIIPDHKHAIECKVNVLVNQNKVVELLQWYDEMLAVDPKNIAVLLHKANTLHCLVRDSEAIGCYNIILAVDSRNIDALYGKIKVLEFIIRA